MLGTESDSILITGQPSSTWYGLYCRNGDIETTYMEVRNVENFAYFYTSVVRMQNSVFDSAMCPVLLSQAYSSGSDSSYLNDVEIRNSQSHGLSLLASPITLTNVRIHDCGSIGLFSLLCDSLILDSCEITENDSCGIYMLNLPYPH